MSYRTRFNIILPLFLIAFAGNIVESKIRNCNLSMPVQLSVPIPEKISQSVKKPFQLTATLDIREDLKPPIILVVDLRKEWSFFGWTTVPCPRVKHCRFPLTRRMFKRNGYSYPPKAGVYHIKTNLNLNQIPGYLLKGNYWFYVDVYSGKHKRHVGCIEGKVKLNIKD